MTVCWGRDAQGSKEKAAPAPGKREKVAFPITLKWVAGWAAVFPT